MFIMDVLVIFFQVAKLDHDFDLLLKFFRMRIA